MKTETSATLKANDRELSRTRFFVLNALAPLTTIIEKGDTMQPDAIQDAALPALLLIGNASSRISRMQREKIIGSSIRLYPPPFAKEDESFDLAPPYLFGPDFA